MRTFTVAFPRRIVVTILALIYVAALILSAYWKVPEGLPLKIGILTALIAVGVAWAYLSAGQLQMRVGTLSLIYGAMLLAALFVLNYRALKGVIPWRGDESAHIHHTQVLASNVPELVFFSSLPCLVALFLLCWRSWKWGLIAGAVEVLAAILLVSSWSTFDPGQIAWPRYPSVNYWLYIVPVMFVAPVASPWHEWLYRIVPFMAMAGVAWVCQRELSENLTPRVLLWGLAVGSIPVILYYSSILYTEQLAVFLMVFVCLRIRRLLSADPRQIASEPAWYALILIGFIRDTVLLFLLCFFVCRLVYQAGLFARRPGNRDWRRQAAFELSLAFCIFGPYLSYMVLRSTIATPARSYRPDLSLVSDLQVYRAVGQSFLEQFGPWVVLFLVGLVVLGYRRERLSAAFLLLVATIHPIFFALYAGGAYAGYSRFNLYVAPAIIAGSILALKEIDHRSSLAGLLAACVLIASNLLMSPLHIDGSKVPLWGNYLTDTSEHYYPYDDAMTWLRQHFKQRSILFTGMDYDYDPDFYIKQLHWRVGRAKEIVSYSANPADDFRMAFYDLAWHPRRRIDELWASGAAPSETQQLRSTLQSASEGTYGIVVYQVLGVQVPDVTAAGAFRLQKVFQNEAHTLLVYFRNP